eukprot:g28602.t1
MIGNPRGRRRSPDYPALEYPAAKAQPQWGPPDMPGGLQFCISVADMRFEREESGSQEAAEHAMEVDGGDASHDSMEVEGHDLGFVHVAATVAVAAAGFEREKICS